MSEVSSHFEGFADYGRYGRGLWRAYRRRAGRLLAERLGPPPWRVLDLGGGSMPSLPELLDDARVSSWQVVDLVDKLTPRPPKVAVHRGDVSAFVGSYDGPPFDAVICFGLLMYLRPETSRALLVSLAHVTREGALLLSHEPHASSASLLDGALERPVDVAAEAAPAWSPLLTERHNHPRLWSAATRLIDDPLLEGPLGDAAMALEPRLGNGLDTLTLLRRAG